jgi:hypothetical protein
MTEPNYNSALAGANARFPGAIPGGAALPPQSIDAQIQALLVGPLAASDNIMRGADIKTLVEANTYQMTPAPFGANDGRAATMQSIGQKNILPALVKALGFDALYVPQSYLLPSGECCYSYILSAPANAVISTVGGLLEIVTGLPAAATPGVLTGLVNFTPGWVSGGNPINAACIQFTGGVHKINNGIGAPSITAGSTGGLLFVQGRFLTNTVDAVP